MNPKAKLDKESVRLALELFRYLRPYRARFAAAMVALVVASLLNLGLPYPAGSIVDAAVLKSHGGLMTGVDQTAFLLVGVLAVQAGFQFFQGEVPARAASVNSELPEPPQLRLAA